MLHGCYLLKLKITFNKWMPFFRDSRAAPIERVSPDLREPGMQEGRSDDQQQDDHQGRRKDRPHPPPWAPGCPVIPPLSGIQ
jgi:hypothetical protein